MIALVGFSRMYLGVHYLTDVLAAIAEGVGWISLCLLFVSAIRRRRNQSNGFEITS
jgi:undecaprenyl-diphosphatase